MKKSIIALLSLLLLPIYANEEREKDSLALIAIKEKNPEPLNGKWILSMPIDKWSGVHVNKNGRVDSLRLQQHSLKIIPHEIGQFSELEYINFSYNNIDTIAPEIGLCTSLTHLDLEYNDLISLPTEIGNLFNVDTVTLHDNKIEELPSSMGSLKKLQYLRVSHNQLTEIPTSFSGMESVEVLNFTKNQISEYPSSMCNLPELYILALPFNNIKQLPQELGNIPKLFDLYLNFNHLSTLPVSLLNHESMGTIEVLSNHLFRENLDAGLAEWLDKECQGWDLSQSKESIVNNINDGNGNSLNIYYKNGKIFLPNNKIQSLKIYSLTGRLIYSDLSSKSEYLISNITSGVYIVDITLNSRILVEKLYIN